MKYLRRFVLKRLPVILAFVLPLIVLLVIMSDSRSRGLDWSLWASEEEGIMLFGRGLWDWADLLIIPIVLAIGGYFLQRTERQTDREIAEKRRISEQEIAKENTLNSTLDSYLDRMTELLLEKGLRDSDPDSELRDVARTWTISTIRRLDGERNSILFRFLVESNLLVEEPVIGFSDANLREVDLKNANLETANLKEVDLMGTDLRGANLWGVNFRRANLCKTDLSKATLKIADLERANLVDAELREANLGEANLWKAKLMRANLRKAYLVEACLKEAYLMETNLSKANLVMANLEGADLEGANLEGAYLEKAIMPDGTEYSESTDLTKFTNPEQ